MSERFYSQGLSQKNYKFHDVVKAAHTDTNVCQVYYKHSVEQHGLTLKSQDCCSAIIGANIDHCKLTK